MDQAKALLQPLYMREANERERQEFKDQVKNLESMYEEEAVFLSPLELGSMIPQEADAVVFPQMLGAVFGYKEALKELRIPILVLTSEFGTVEMWDWEIVSYLREELGCNVFSPYRVEMAKVVMRAIAAGRRMRGGLKFLMFQDDPGEGMQAYIFKRFYWWETECRERIEQAFGVQIIFSSWKEVNDRAAQISDEQAWKLWEERKVPVQEVSKESILRAVKLYIAIKEEADELGDVCAVGSNCLNESFLSRTTPCLAYDWLFEYDHILWACEGDLVTLISKFILYSALKHPVMMTNIYPFLVGMAALKHEKIMEFPDIEDPDNHALGVHCGYFGFAPRCFCDQWVMKPKVLEIVNQDAIVIDCRMKTGDVTLAKLHPNMKVLTIIEAQIEDYVQYPGSDCRNGALLKYKNNSGHKVMEKLSSHHAIIVQGNVTPELLLLAGVYGFETEVL
ncbi:hypothetical protein [Diplocloster agilis]|uniref:Fucose isomerase n=1 Tax=Diplocloster agilis TaxID=2850323 RepID=A0A949JXF4_9FIRM|nr:hypothetical protein [Diplocloster agilis]MBU9736394.1 hypothetical protein [Diplocloster agilis]